MTRPQRSESFRKAFAERGLVMRWPGFSPVSPVLTKWSAAESEGIIAHRALGQCRRVVVLGGAVQVREGGVTTGAEWSRNEVKSR
jgi:hypothetical protein